MDNNKRKALQEYVYDFWDTMSADEQACAIAEGFKAPTKCEVITVDFTFGLGEIGRYIA